MSHDVLELAQNLIRRPSVTPEDAGCQDLIAGLLEPAGFSVEHLPCGDVSNLWLRHGDAAPCVVFAGHTDVVPTGPAGDWEAPPFGATIRDGRLIGRGAADMKGSLAAMVRAAERFVSRYPDHAGSLAMLITSDEEGPGEHGTQEVMRTLDARAELFEYCVVGEPSSSAQLGDTVRNGRRGSLSGLMTIRSTQSHVAYPLPTENPIHSLARFVSAMTREPIDAGNHYFPPTTFQMVNVASDAGAPNVVPGTLKCRFNFRYSTEWTAETLIERVEHELAALGIDHELTWRMAGRPFLTEEGVLTEAVCSAVRDETGETPELSTSGGTSDGRYIAPYGIDVVELGPLNATIHKVDEQVAAGDLERLERIYFGVAEKLLVRRR